MNDIILSEAQVHDIIIHDAETRSGIKEILQLSDNYTFIHEDEYINGIIADFTVIDKSKIRSIVEVKGSSINVTDYVRGLGQLLQYHHFFEMRTPHKSFEYDDNFKSMYIIPSRVFINNQFNIGEFNYPSTTILAEINEYNHTIRRIEAKEFESIRVSKQNQLISISPYYFRDNRVFEYFILLKILNFSQDLGAKCCHRGMLEINVLRKLEVINNGNWRNAFITLSSLGLINSNNLPTLSGKKLITNNYADFAIEMFYSYIQPYSIEILKCFKHSIVEMSNHEMSDLIRSSFNGKDVLFLTQSSNRYISSWLNIMRDDYGIITFKPRQNKRILNYNPLDLNRRAFKENIEKYSIASKYIEDYQKKIREVKLNEIFDF